MVTYHDFKIQIVPADDGTFQVNISSPAGSGSSRLDLPSTLTTGLGDRLARIGQMVRGETRGLTFGHNPRETVGDYPRETITPKQLGKLLFKSVFHGSALSLLQESIRMKKTGEGLRIRLIMDPSHSALAQFSQLPWELMCRNDLGEFDPGGFLNLSHLSPLVRFLEAPHKHDPIPIEFKPPFRILVVISSPSGVDSLDLERERQLIKDNWGRRSDVQVDFLDKATTSELQRQLGEADYHALHFMGHGHFDETTGRGTLIMEKEDESPEYVSGEALGVLLADEPTLRLAFLNACNTAQATDKAEQNPFSGVAAALVMAGIPAVVAMQFPITDEAAIAFSDTFYGLLPQCHPIDYIVAEARKAIHQLQESRGGMEWATPVVFMRSPDGVIFESVYRLEPLSGKNSNVYSRLASKVRKFWIEGKLDLDVPIKPPIELSKDLLPHAVRHQMSGDDAEEVPAGKTTATLFDEKERSLLILGEAGYGKTITLLALAQYLLKRYEQDQSMPIPLFLCLSTWGDSKLAIQAWAAREAFEKYKISDKLCTQWITDGRIVLLLDGLDDLPTEEQRGECVKAINAFSAEQIRRTHFHGVAVSCRFEDYKRLTVRFNFEGAIQLRPLSPAQIKRYLGMFGESMAGLQACLEREPGLLQDAQSPLMLGMLSVAYSLNPSEFSSLAQDASSETDSGLRRQLVVNAYLDRVFQRGGDESAPFSREETIASLSWLAKRMKEHHHSVFLIESLQPNWLRSKWEQVLSNALFSLMLGVLVATVLAIVWNVSVAVDPPTDPTITVHEIRNKTEIVLKQPTIDAHRWWYLVTPIWIFAVVSWEGWKIDRFNRRLRGTPNSRMAVILHYASAAATYFVMWVFLWLTVLVTIRLTTGSYANSKDFWSWMSHPLQGGISVAVLCALRGRGPNTSTYIGTAEQLRWSWRRSVIGLLIGLALGLLLWIVSYPFNTEHQGRIVFFLTLWSVVGLLYGGLLMDVVKTKTRPNEGIVLSLRNSLIGACLNGPIIGIALLIILMVVFPFKWQLDKPIISDKLIVTATEYIPEFTSASLQNKLFPALKLGVVASLISFWWFGGTDVMRHYALRLTLRLTGQLPLNLPALFDHATHCDLLRRIGGGYIFCNNLLRDHFERFSPEQESNENGATLTKSSNG